MTFFLYCELFRAEETSLAFAAFLLLGTCLGLWTLLLQLCVQCSDPGIVFPLGAETDPAFRAHCMDLDEVELAAYPNDPIYKKSIYYQYRNCSTCV